jgi:hypothetical protein
MMADINDLNIEQEISYVLSHIDEKVTVEIVSRQQEYKNSIRPSQLTLKKDSLQQAYFFFDPEVLKDCGFEIPARSFNSLKNRKIKRLDDAGIVNTSVGTFLHALILYPLEKRLRAKGYDAIVEFPVYSHETAISGTCDLIILEEDFIHVYDLKTTGAKILERDEHVSDDYERQLYAYSKTLLNMFPKKQIGELAIVSLCKTPGSYMDGEPLPLTAVCKLDYKKLFSKHDNMLADVTAHVKRINNIIKEKNPKYNHWLLDNTEPNAWTKAITEVEERLV